MNPRSLFSAAINEEARAPQCEEGVNKETRESIRSEISALFECLSLKASGSVGDKQKVIT